VVPKGASNETGIVEASLITSVDDELDAKSVSVTDVFAESTEDGRPLEVIVEKEVNVTLRDFDRVGIFSSKSSINGSQKMRLRFSEGGEGELSEVK
jgi:hypothetical protein